MTTSPMERSGMEIATTAGGLYARRRREARGARCEARGGRREAGAEGAGGGRREGEAAEGG